MKSFYTFVVAQRTPRKWKPIALKVFKLELNYGELDAARGSIKSSAIVPILRPSGSNTFAPAIGRLERKEVLCAIGELSVSKAPMPTRKTTRTNCRDTGGTAPTYWCYVSARSSERMRRSIEGRQSILTRPRIS